LSLEIKEGVVHARYTIYPPGDEPLELQMHFVKVIDNHTVQWGIHNGRGPGVQVYTAKLSDENTLMVNTNGVGFIHGPPPGTFKYRRKQQ
jgi:hypothetical protein